MWHSNTKFHLAQIYSNSIRSWATRHVFSLYDDRVHAAADHQVSPWIAKSPVGIGVINPNNLPIVLTQAMQQSLTVLWKMLLDIFDLLHADIRIQALDDSYGLHLSQITSGINEDRPQRQGQDFNRFCHYFQATMRRAETIISTSWSLNSENKSTFQRLEHPQRRTGSYSMRTPLALSRSITQKISLLCDRTIGDYALCQWWSWRMI